MRQGNAAARDGQQRQLSNIDRIKPCGSLAGDLQPSGRRYHVDGITISDSLDTPALAQVPHPALTAIQSGLDLLLYGNFAADAINTYDKLSVDVQDGALSGQQVQRAAGKVLALKRSLGLPG